MSSPWQYFVDPVLRAPTIGSMLMCLASSLIGVIVFIRKRSLLGETLSHASYPGVVLSIIIVSSLFPHSENAMAIGVLIGAFIFSWIGLIAIDFLEQRLKVKNDAALCFVLASFFGLGILIASRIQVTHALWYKQIQVFLYGQTATMVDLHVLVYGILCVATIAILIIFFRQIEMIHFDREFARSVGAPVRQMDQALFFLLVLAIVIGIRCVGVVLMSGMLIAPPVAARQFTHRLSWLFVCAGVFGMLSGFLGNYLSAELPLRSGFQFSLPTGPMILLSASAICLIALLFAPRFGLFSRFWRVTKFRNRCALENLLKLLWKQGPDIPFTISEIAAKQNRSTFLLNCFLRHLVFKGFLEKTKATYRLTAIGRQKAARIVRLHRLWEVYLVDYLGQRAEKVHCNAEEMEHIITPELEIELIELLRNPKKDPHEQPIPEV